MSGRFIPLMVNPAPLALALDTVTLEPPELVSTSDVLLVVPTGTAPKLMLAGLGVNPPGLVAVPESAICMVGLAELFETDMVPLKLPADFGANVTLKLAFCPPTNVMGKLRPVS